MNYLVFQTIIIDIYNIIINDNGDTVFYILAANRLALL